MPSSRLQAALSDVTQGRITRAEFLARAVGLGMTVSAAAALVAACGSGTSSTTAAGSASPTPLDSSKPDHIILFNWSDYMDPGVLKAFQREYGVKVKESYFEDNDTMLAKVKAGATGYDVIVPTGWMVSIMAKTGLLRPLDMSLLPNFSGVMPAFQSPSYDPGTGGKRYSVPYMFGRTGIDVRQRQGERDDHELAVAVGRSVLGTRSSCSPTPAARSRRLSISSARTATAPTWTCCRRPSRS